MPPTLARVKRMWPTRSSPSYAPRESSGSQSPPIGARPAFALHAPRVDTQSMLHVLNIVAGIAAALVLLACARFAYGLSHLRTLAKSASPAPAEWPLVSVIIAGRNEASAVGPAFASRLAEDYPNLEIIFVDDRSIDRTGEVVRRTAGADPRVHVLRVEELPSGWLGKVHALARGVDAAQGEWLLFSDADVRVMPHALRQAVAFALEHGYDMLAVIPEYRTGSFGVDAAWAAFMRALAIAMDPAKVRDPRSSAAIGSGAFNLVRRQAFDRTPGFEHLRLETGDDAALGQMVKQAGGLLDMVDGRGLATVAVYRSIRELIRGVEKNGSTMADRPFALVVLGFAAWLIVELTPLAVTLGWTFGVVPPWLGLLSAVAAVLNTASYSLALWVNTRTWAAGLVWPFGISVLTFAVVRSTWLARRQLGVYWRGTFYPLDDLQAGKRYDV